MARTVRDTSLETRAARLRLVPQAKPYWRSIETGLHVGYRRLRQGGGTWVARRFCSGRYSERQLGTADDLQDPDGTVVLSFREAQEADRAWWKTEMQVALGLEPVRGPYSVAMALEDYVQDYLRRGGRDLENLRSIGKAHIVPALGSVDTAKLTTKRLRDWHHGLATSPRLTRGSRNATLDLQAGPEVANPETVRKRRSRADRVLTVLKAARNSPGPFCLLGNSWAHRRTRRTTPL
jgi:hypothetical protein